MLTPDRSVKLCSEETLVTVELITPFMMELVSYSSSVLALLPGVPIVLFMKAVLFLELVGDLGVTPWMVLLALLYGVAEIPRPISLFLAAEARQDSSIMAGSGFSLRCLASLQNLSVFRDSLRSAGPGEMQANMLM